MERVSMKSKFIFPLLILLTGCTNTVYVDRPQYLYPEDSWLTSVPYATPPDRAAFEKAVVETRILMFGKAYMEQTANLGKCNAKVESIAKWKAETMLKK
jgi:hypothetical protein